MTSIAMRTYVQNAIQEVYALVRVGINQGTGKLKTCFDFAFVL